MLARLLEKIFLRYRCHQTSCLFRLSVIALVFIYLTAGYGLVSYYNVQRFSGPNLLFWDIATAWDDAIPLIPAFTFPYQLYIPLLIFPALLDVSVRRLLELAALYCIASTMAWSFHLLLPVRIEHAELLCSGLSCEALKVLRVIDPGVNLLPSLHVAHSMLAVAFVWRERHLSFPWVLAVALMIVTATVLIKQHYLIDIPAGLLTAVFTWYLVNYLSTHHFNKPAKVKA
jgi:hypothetical protein